jgi:hypothetical protein
MTTLTPEQARQALADWEFQNINYGFSDVLADGTVETIRSALQSIAEPSGDPTKGFVIEALQFYGNRENYTPNTELFAMSIAGPHLYCSKIDLDHGALARRATDCLAPTTANPADLATRIDARIAIADAIEEGDGPVGGEWAGGYGTNDLPAGSQDGTHPPYVPSADWKSIAGLMVLPTTYFPELDFMLVPIDPTVAMCSVTVSVPGQVTTMNPVWNAAVYKAMIAAYAASNSADDKEGSSVP